MAYEASARTPATRDAAPDAAMDLLRRAITHRARVFAPDQTLVTEDDEKTHIIAVSSGLLRCSRMTPDGRRLVTRFVRAGGMIGLGRLPVFRSSVEAVTASGVIEFPIPAVDAACSTLEHIRNIIFDAFTAELSARDRAQFRLGRLWAEERVADFLMEAAAATADGVRGELRMSRADIADHLGVTIETISRALRCFQKDGLIRLDGPRHFQIVRTQQLKALALGDSDAHIWRDTPRVHSLH